MFWDLIQVLGKVAWFSVKLFFVVLVGCCIFLLFYAMFRIVGWQFRVVGERLGFLQMINQWWRSKSRKQRGSFWEEVRYHERKH